MNFGQTMIYSLKPFAATKVGDVMRNATKTLAGATFDLLCRDYRTEGCVFSIPLSHTTRRMRAKFLLDTYELPERTLVKKYLAAGASVLELGASLGIVSCIVNHRLSDRTRHVAAEVNPQLIPFVEHNRQRNECRFVIEGSAVTGADAMLFRSGANSDGGRISGHEGVPVPTRDLFDIEAAYGLSFDTIVMDIEGAEVGFIAEYEAILPRINTMIVEFHPSIVGDENTQLTRARIISAGLRPVEKILEVEAFVRPAS